MIASICPPDLAREVWPLLEPFIDGFAGSSSGELTVHDLQEDIFKGTRQVWVVYSDSKVKAVALTEIEPGGVWLNFCSGEDAEEWRKDLVDVVKKFAADHGERLKVFCRPGWARWLKREYGMRETHRFLEVAV